MGLVTQGGKTALTWHWSANNGFALNHPVRGWNECLIAYILAASAPRYSVPAEVYHEGWAQGREFVNRRTFEGVELPLGPDWGGAALFHALLLLRVDPRGLSDNYADYWAQNVSHTRINYAYCVRNPHGYKGYGPNCWGLPPGIMCAATWDMLPTTTSASSRRARPCRASSTRPRRRWPRCVISMKTSATGSGTLRFRRRISEQYEWRADSYLAISQGPIVVMIENYRSGLYLELVHGDPRDPGRNEEARLQEPALRPPGSMTALDAWIRTKRALPRAK